MTTVLATDSRVQIDNDGFLVDPASWSAAVAREIARCDGMPALTPAHWQVINYLREHYLAHGTLPVMSHVCRVSHLAPHCVTDLFHDSKEAWRVAGLPNPGEEAKSYM